MTAAQFRTHWRAIYEAKLWPAYLAALDELYHRIHDAPPSVDYQRRRLELADVDALIAACRQAAGQLGDDGRVSATETACRFWLNYTGGHRAFAQRALRHAELPRRLSGELRKSIGARLGLLDDEAPRALPP